jgi:mono/diheme cytochrome c family protein
MKKILKVLGIVVLVLLVFILAAATILKVVFPKVGEAPELTIQSTPEKIERGRYLANHVMVCIDCHSSRDWTAFSGPIVPGTFGKGSEVFDQTMGFPGVFYSKNITPYNLGTWTDGEVFRAITTGVNKDNEAIFPVMPHHAYGQLDATDIEAVVSYLRTLTPIKNDVAKSKPDFPFNFIINTIPKEASFSQRPDTNDAVAYGAYLVKAAACIDCHTPVTSTGSLIMEDAFSGGRVFEMPSGTITSSNITPHKGTGIGAWTREQFIQRFKAYEDSLMQHLPVQPSDFNTLMPWTMYASMTESDLGAVYAYLKSLPEKEKSITRFVPRN